MFKETLTNEIRWGNAVEEIQCAVKDCMDYLNDCEATEQEPDKNEIDAYTRLFDNALSELQTVRTEIDYATQNLDNSWYETPWGERVLELLDFNLDDTPDFSDIDELIEAEASFDDLECMQVFENLKLGGIKLD